MLEGDRRPEQQKKKEEMAPQRRRRAVAKRGWGKGAWSPGEKGMKGRRVREEIQGEAVTEVGGN